MSNKWADYLVLRVHYDWHKAHITQVETAVHLGSTVGQKVVLDRQQVVNSINIGVTFVTARLNGSGSYSRGEDVRVFRVNGVDYLRTDGNSRASDNLGSLPEF